MLSRWKQNTLLTPHVARPSSLDTSDKAPLPIEAKPLLTADCIYNHVTRRVRDIFADGFSIFLLDNIYFSEFMSTLSKREPTPNPEVNDVFADEEAIRDAVVIFWSETRLTAITPRFDLPAE